MKDPANVVVLGLILALIIFVVVAKISSDRAQREEKAAKEQKEGKKA